MQKYTDLIKQKGFKGDVDNSEETLKLYSHDASLFEVLPKLVVFPKDQADVEILVAAVDELKSEIPDLSLTARSAGTCMSGGAVNDSVIIEFTKYMNHIGSVSSTMAETEPGVFYRDFEKATLAKGGLLPSFPASRELAALGGMIANNSGGELSLRYGKTEDFVQELNVTLADGKSYTIKPLNKSELDKKMAQKDFEGQLYKDMFRLLDDNYDLVKKSKPNVTKNSTGYNLWDVWDREKGIFDLTKAITGSQGTLGIVNKAKLGLVQEEPYSGVLVAFMRNEEKLGEMINAVMEHKPTSFESFDNYTLLLSIKFFPYFHKTLGWSKLFKLGIDLIPDALVFFRGIPKLVLLIEFTGKTQEEVDQKIKAMQSELEGKFNIFATEDDDTPEKAAKFRIMRRESFNLLRQKVKDKHTAAFIDDLVVPPARLPEFLPQLRAIINKYKLFATVAGHMGDGNFHVIPLMKIEDPAERLKLEPAMKEVNSLVLSYGGVLSGEHNDGMIRGHWLEAKYGKPMTELFRQTKQIFDPKNIFNPHKKTDADWNYSKSHIRQNF